MTDDPLAAEVAARRGALHDVYAQAALEPDTSLCCVDGGAWTLPDLVIPPRMLEMNYGCGSTVHPTDLTGSRPILYVGVGGGLEALQFAYFRRRPGGVIAVDPVAEMRDAAQANLIEAERLNPWFRRDFVQIVDGRAEELPVDAGSVEVVAQNCLFNVFVAGDLAKALSEVVRVLKVGGRFSTSDPITPRPIPQALRDDNTLRARCVSGCVTYDEYLAALHRAGLQQLVVRARRPYRLLTPAEFKALDRELMLESLELLAIKGPRVEAAPDVYTGRCATFVGKGTWYRDDKFPFQSGTPMQVSDRVAAELGARPDFRVSAPTWHARGPGCC
ncbi:MAG: methyltransferase domain-containing protein [Planctomycetes bacterium]|nr:methyltransferase domain-containing protein [Planctomycetota bacterium]